MKYNINLINIFTLYLILLIYLTVVYWFTLYITFKLEIHIDEYVKLRLQ